MRPQKQNNPYQSPWPWWVQVVLILWRSSWLLFCRWTPKFLNFWRLTILKFFGAQISGTPFVHSSARITIPWHLNIGHRACIGEFANIYSLGPIEIHEGATIAQETYLCTATHDFKDPNFQLLTSKIIVQKDAFIGVRALVMPGITIGEGAIVGAMSVVTKNIPSNETFAGIPAKVLCSNKTNAKKL